MPGGQWWGSLRLIVLIALLAPLPAAITRAVGQAADRPPDVVVVVTDDMRASDWQALPQTKNQLAGGTWFPNFVFTTPLCCPSRASLLTGRYAHNHGVKTNYAPGGGYEAFQKHNNADRTVATWLDTAGYRTSLVGKFLNGYDGQGRPPGWDDWHPIEGKPTYEMAAGYSTDVFRDRAVSFVTATPDQEPLFLWFAPNAPHNPATPANRHRDEFAGANVPGGKALDKLERRRLQTLLAVDEAVVAIAEAMGPRWDDACVFVLSDNGWLMGEHGVVGKAQPWEGSVRVPMLARCPGLSSGTDDRIAANIDLAPTIAAVAGIEPGDPVDGRSLLADQEREMVLIRGWPKKSGSPKFAGIWTADLLYVERRRGRPELYDRRTDPGERHDVADDRDYERLVRDLRDRLDDLRRCQGDDCREAEDAPLEGVR